MCVVDVSVIIPLYKGIRYIDEKIKMIRNANVDKRVEIIFVNDYPEDNDFVDSYIEEKGNYIKIIKHSVNQGIHQSRVDGLKKARGKWILFLDQDDSIEPLFFSIIEKKSGENVSGIACNGYWRGVKEVFSEEIKSKKRFTNEKDYIKYGYPLVSTGQLIIKKNEIPVEWIDHPLEHNGCDDLLLWIMLMIDHKKIVICDEIYYKHIEHDANASFNYGEMAESIAECVTIIEKQKKVNEDSKKKIKKRLNDKYYKYSCYNEVFELNKTIDKDIISDYFVKKRWNEVAIYGYGIIGKMLEKQLDSANINIKYIIDDKMSVIERSDKNIKAINDRLDYVDIIIVTPIYEYEEIEKTIKKNIHFPTESILNLYKEMAKSNH
ncbi:MAG: glycosyltransferase [Lachnospiraceae bacterium]|nr:glycosyltransferase [Lachnospiraceae bacterium]